MSNLPKNFKGVNLINKKFGKLTVIDFSHKTNSGYYWICKCKCGNIKIVLGSHLTHKRIRSCGCLRRDTIFKDLTGKEFGKLRVIRYDHTDKRRSSYWLCKCKCGNYTIVESTTLTSGRTMSCGCNNYRIYNEIGILAKDCKLYNVYKSMLARCYNHNTKAYKDYGGRGIYVCNEWLNDKTVKDDISGFLNFYHWAHNNGYHEQDPNIPRSELLTIERKDVNGPYAPWNCEWIIMFKQGSNKRNNRYIFDNEEKLTWSEFERKYNLYPEYVKGRIKRWSENAIIYSAKHKELGIHHIEGQYYDKDDFIVLIPKPKD